jgi:hypothetical protein
MAYIGKQPVVGNFVKLDAITTSATATYNLLNGGVAYFPQTANNCIVSLNGVIQSPTSAYTISGSTIVFSDALTASDSIDFILVLGDVLAIGTPSDGTITSAKLASGLSGLISWQSVQTTGFTASAGRGYPCNTTSAAFTVTLPASPSVGDQVLLLDYAGTFATNNITLGRNSNKIEGGTNNKILTTNREAVTLTYVDSTQGWVSSSGANEGTQSIDPITYSADILVVAGGGGGGGGNVAGGGGGGGGGYRTSTQTLNGGTVYTITVGDGGAGVGGGGYSTTRNPGSNSSISGSGLTTITSAGGGGGSSGNIAGENGGSGGGGNGGYASGGGSGNTPSTSPSQGNNGGSGGGTYGAGGGGGASATGSNGSTNVGGNGGNGTASSITGSSVTYAGGGGGGPSSGGTKGLGGTGGGGNSIGAANADNGTVNLGGGGGGGDGTGSGYYGGNGGKGVVILSVPDANYSGTTTGSPTVATGVSGKTVLTFTGSGTYTG